ncbi:MAG: hypothetical protein IPL61_08835 [Myxococcales bacterium]|nr:hypothetical protein [Myxococcales bacterium]
MSTGYLASFKPDSSTLYAAKDADAAASADHVLIPPAIALTTDYALAQQDRFAELMREGRPGADDLHQVYVDDERLQDAAGIDYDDFVAAARLATRSVVRYDFLLKRYDSDGDLANNFALDPTTAALTTSALQHSGADRGGDSLTKALADARASSRTLASTGKKLRGAAQRMRATAALAQVDEDQGARDDVDHTIEKFGAIAALVEVGVKAATGSADVSMLTDVAKTGTTLATDGQGPGLATDPSSLAETGARLYYAKEIQALEAQIAGGKKIAATLTDSAAQAEVDALLDDLMTQVAHHAAITKHAEAVLEDRRKDYAQAGTEVDASADSAGTEEGEVSEALLLGAAASEARVLLTYAEDAATGASASVGAAVTNSSGRRKSYFTADDTFEINGHDQYLPRGRSDDLGDDPDLATLYTMTKAIERWQDAVPQASAHLDLATGLFQQHIVEPSGGSDTY